MISKPHNWIDWPSHFDWQSASKTCVEIVKMHGNISCSDSEFTWLTDWIYSHSNAPKQNLNAVKNENSHTGFMPCRQGLCTHERIEANWQCSSESGTSGLWLADRTYSYFSVSDIHYNALQHVDAHSLRPTHLPTLTCASTCPFVWLCLTWIILR